MLRQYNLLYVNHSQLYCLTDRIQFLRIHTEMYLQKELAELQIFINETQDSKIPFGDEATNVCTRVQQSIEIMHIMDAIQKQ